MASCGPAPASRAVAPAPPAPVAGSEPAGTTVVVVTVDGARWEEVFRGVDPALGGAYGLREHELIDARSLVPNLAGLVSGYGAALGAPEVGAEIRASGPNFVSLPGYTELFTGRGPSTCRDNACGATTEPTVIDELTARFGCSPEDAAVVTSWPDIGRVAAMRPDCSSMSSA